VFVEAWPGARQWTAGLRQAMLNRRAAGEGVTKSNLLGWQSDVDMLRWGGEASGALCDYVVKRCKTMTLDLLEPRPQRWQAEMWANISSHGASNQTHAHPGAFWSAVHYVDDGYAGSNDRELGGELTFIDPRFPMIRTRTPSLRRRGLDGQADHQDVWLRPKSGLIVYFPSWLQHAVRPYLGVGERMSIAINVTIFAEPGLIG
jgi:uncharacterized protein (TIGR02466 family)